MGVTNRVIARAPRWARCRRCTPRQCRTCPGGVVRRSGRVHGAARLSAASSPPRARAYDEDAWRRLWEVSEELTGVHYEFTAPASGLTDLRADGAAALEWAARYLERVGELPVLAQVEPGEIRSRLPELAPSSPSRSPPCCATSTRCCCPGVTHWQHPRYFAYFAASSSEPAILAELLAADAQLGRRSCGGPRRRRPSSRAWCSTGWRSCSGCPQGWHGHIEDTRLDLDARRADRRGAGGDRARSDRVLGAGALVGRQGGADARDAAAQGRRSTTAFRDARRAAR